MSSVESEESSETGSTESNYSDTETSGLFSESDEDSVDKFVTTSLSYQDRKISDEDMKDICNRITRRSYNKNSQFQT